MVQTPQTAKAIAEYLCETGDGFADAFDWAEPFLMHVERPGRVIYKLCEENELLGDFPEVTLRLLEKIVSPNGPAYERYKLRPLLDQIGKRALS